MRGLPIRTSQADRSAVEALALSGRPVDRACVDRSRFPADGHSDTQRATQLVGAVDGGPVPVTSQRSSEAVERQISLLGADLALQLERLGVPVSPFVLLSCPSVLGH